MEKYEFNVVGAEIYSFVWDDFCDWYIELSKINMNNTTKSVLITVLTNILKMLHPFMPYVTDEIYDKLPVKDNETIMLSSYPQYNEKQIYKEFKEMENTIELIKNIRKIKLENNIGKDYYLVHNNKVIIENINIFEKILKLENKIIEKNNFHMDNLTNISINFNNDIVNIYFDNSSNLEQEKENLIKEKKRLENSILRREKLLSNENYVNKAPESIVNQERENLLKEKKELELLLTRID